MADDDDADRQRSLWKESLLWRAMAPVPCGMVRPHVVSRGTSVYVGGGNTGKTDANRTVFRLDLGKNLWSSLPITPYHTFSLAIVGDRVTVIGGVSILTSQVSSALASYEYSIGATGKWAHTLPEMPTRRCCTSSTTIGDHLVVVGGIGKNDSYLKGVEVLDVRSKQWHTVCDFPKPVTFMSITASSTRIFLTGGLTNTGPVKSIYSCTLDNLLHSSLAEKRETKQVWHEIVAAPCLRSGCCVVKEKLVVFGGVANKEAGMEEVDGISSSVYVLQTLPSSNEKGEWKLLGKMAAKRSSMSLGITGTTSVIMIGGYVDSRNWMSSLTNDVMEVVNLVL